MQISNYSVAYLELICYILILPKNSLFPDAAVKNDYTTQMCFLNFWSSEILKQFHWDNGKAILGCENVI